MNRHDMHIYSVTAADKGQRLDKYIKRLLPKAPSSCIYKNLRTKNILLNGRKANGNEIVRMGDEVRIYFSDETIEKFGGIVHGGRTGGLPGDRERAAQNERSRRTFGHTSSDLAPDSTPDHSMERVLAARQASRVISRQYPQVRILYEDRDIAAAYKPAGLLSQKAKEGDSSLNEWFLGMLLERGEITEQSLHMFTPSVQNRLDRGTEGLVMLAKTLQGSHLLTRLQRERSLRKYYVMIVCGQLRSGGQVEGWLAKDPESNRVAMYEEEQPGTVYSQTVYRPLAWSSDGKLTGVEAELLTGRTHQLRAHMAYLGHPILGDRKYGNPDINRPYRQQGVTSQMLLCQRVEFPQMEEDFEHLSGKVIQAPLPPLYLQLMR